jgi:multicomponent Na+:H+ antiporter subunit G
MIVSILLILAWIYIIFGIIGISKSKKLYGRLLASSTIDTVALLTILIALMVAAEHFSYIIRLATLSIFILITTPITGHVIIRSAYLNGVQEKEGEKHGDPT